ncbi:MAG: hypothetical protein PHD36_02510 [Desulfotomaculaceae bacterium]|nr:hypothetical protein [Desulfotomaculaceae bacterium]
MPRQQPYQTNVLEATEDGPWDGFITGLVGKKLPDPTWSASLRGEVMPFIA